MFQKEFYNIRRVFFHILKKYILLRGKKLGDVHYTSKIKILLFLSFLSQLLIVVLIWYVYHNYILIVSTVIVVALLTPFFILFSQLLSYPIEKILKDRIVRQARKKLASLKDCTVIGIIGSYGKTSTKHVLYHLLKNNKSTITTSGNTNTLLGVANFILHEVQPNHKIIIVEMGEHYPGDIQDLCKLIQPSIIILTGLTLQHAERMGTIQDIAAVLFEFVDSASVRQVFYNADDENIIHAVEHYKDKIHATCIPIVSTDVVFEQDFSGTSFVYKNHTIHTKLLGKHVTQFMMVAFHIAKDLDIPLETITKQVPLIPYVDHRLQMIHNPVSNIFVIDDSYNGNIQGVKATIQIVHNTPFQGKKIYITPGLMELGMYAQDIHKELATLLYTDFDFIILIDNNNTQIVHDALLLLNYPKENIVTYATREQAHANLKTYVQPGCLVVFQNDIPSGF